MVNDANQKVTEEWTLNVKPFKNAFSRSVLLRIGMSGKSKRQSNDPRE